MAKKKKIREQFDVIFKSGNEKAIKKMLDKYPWLLSEVSSEMEKDMGDQQQLVAALGVMEDELGGAVPVDEIAFSLKVDFGINLEEEEVLTILKKVEELGLVKRDTDGWKLTREGGRICDEFLNRNLRNYS